jgi:hypothetical protein
MTLFYLSVGILFLQTAISIASFSQSSVDRGAWPIVLAIIGAADFVYAIVLNRLIRQHGVLPLHAAVSTLALSVLMFMFNNFAWLFGHESAFADTNLHLGVLESDLTPYALRLLFALAPLLTRSHKGSTGHK